MSEDTGLPGWYPAETVTAKHPSGRNPYGDPLTADGQHNLKWWAWEFQRVHTYAIESLEAGGKFDPTKYTKHLEAQMKARGINLAEMGSNKADLLIIDHPEEWFEQSEGVLKRMQEEAKKLIDMARKSDLEALDLVTDLSESQVGKLKRAIKLIDGVIALQRFCREKNPSRTTCRTVSRPADPWGEGVAPENEKDNTTMRYLHPLRMMLYVMRSTSRWRGLAEWDYVMDMSKHLAVMCCTIERARDKDCIGAMLELPPGHGKTNLGLAGLAMRIAENPEINTAIIHHKADMASDRLVALREMMTPNNPTGRRFTALFPKVRIRPGASRPSSTEFTVDRRSGSKDPTCRSFGVNEAVQGSDLHEIFADDIVDEKERDEETTRNRTFTAFTAGFLPRLRGDGTFFVMAYTPWHLDDAHGRIKRTRKQRINGVADIALCQLPCGTSQDEFRPLWGRIGREKLKAIKRRIGPVMFDCLYHLNPVSKASRIVSRLTYVHHDPEDDRTQEFLSTSRMVVSVDPTATVGKTADKAGIIYAAVNELVPQIRILEAWEVSAIQMDLAAFVAELCATREVHEIIVETIAGHHATADALEHDYGFPPEMVARVGTKNKSKDVRLRAIAIHLEQGKIAFAGETMKNDDGTETIRGKPEYDWLYDQILKFGATDRDHAVDAVTQLGIRYAASLWTGEDFKTDEQKRMIDESRRFYRNGRMYRHFQSIMRIRHQNTTHVNAVLENVNVERDVDNSAEYGVYAWN